MCPDFSKLPQNFPHSSSPPNTFPSPPSHHISHGSKSKIILWTSKHLMNLTYSQQSYKHQDHYYPFGWWDVQELLLRSFLHGLFCQEIVTAYMSPVKPETTFLSHVFNVWLENILTTFSGSHSLSSQKAPHRFCICQSLQMSHRILSKMCGKQRQKLHWDIYSPLEAQLHHLGTRNDLRTAWGWGTLSTCFFLNEWCH